MIYFWLTESLTAEKRGQKDDKRPALTLKALITALQRPFTRDPCSSREFFFGTAFAILQTIFSLYALTKFGMSATDTGYILAYVGVLSVITQGFLVGRLSGLIRDDVLITAGVGLMAISLAGWALASSVLAVLIILAPMSLSGGLLNTLLSSTLTKAVDSRETGGILGLSAAIESSTRVIHRAGCRRCTASGRRGVGTGRIRSHLDGGAAVLRFGR